MQNKIKLFFFSKITLNLINLHIRNDVKNIVKIYWVNDVFTQYFHSIYMFLITGFHHTLLVQWLLHKFG